MADPDPPAEELARTLGFALGRVAEHGEARFSAAIAPFGLRRSLIGVLHTLAFRGPSTQTEVGQALRVDAAAMSKATAELLERGLVERRPHPGDRRAHHLVLTGAGRDLQRELWRVGVAVQDELFGALDAGEQRTLIDLLRRLPPLAT
jgi:DNA-binding MarR family transcriptional regulator